MIPRPTTVQEAQQRIVAARDELAKVCDDVNKFRMSLPIKDTDTDIVFCAAFDAADWLIRQLEAPINREAFAEYAHDAWSGWMQHMLPILEPLIDTRSIGEALESQPFAVESLARWYRQMNTLYEDLPEYEKDSDRREADKMIAIFHGEDDA